MRYITSIILSITIIASCSFEEKLDELRSDLESQQELINTLYERASIIGFDIQDNTLKISFADGKSYLVPTENVPLFWVGSNGNWYINNTDTKINSTSQSPVISVQDGFWTIDGELTSLKVNIHLGIEQDSEKGQIRLESVIQTAYVIYFHFSDGSVISSSYATSIVSFNPESEYNGLIANLQYQEYASSIKPLVLCHFSDIHGTSENVTRIIQFCDYFKCTDDIICSGDMIAGSFNEHQFKYWEEVNAGNILTCIGNHDTAKYPENGTYAWTYYGGKMAYERYFLPYLSTWGVVQPADAAEKGYCYYYKDYPESQVRMIVLDCMMFDEIEAEWFKSVLMETISMGYSAVCVSHYTPAVSKPFKSNYNFYPFECNGEITCTTVNEYAVGIVDDYISCGGDFICWLTGHIHVDSVGYSPEHSNQIILSVEAATYEAAQTIFAQSPRTKDTRAQDSFNLVSFDIKNGLIKVVRVGNIYDNYFRNKLCFVVDYKNKKMMTM